jgi:integrase
MTRYALVKIIDEETPLWSEMMVRYIGHIKSLRKPDTMRCTIIPALKTFSAFIKDGCIGDLTPDKADEWCSLMRLNHKPNTVRTKVAIIRQVYDYAISIGKIQSNPLDRVKMPKQVNSGKPLTDEQLGVLLPAIRVKYRWACILSLLTGLRRGEICSLEWWQVGADTITIPAEKSKSGRSRVVFLTRRARSCLGPRKKGFVYTIKRDELSAAVTRASRRTGIKATFHSFRHTAASVYMDKNRDLFGMLDAFGWASPKSAAPYQHISTDRQRSNMGRVTYRFLTR